MQAPSLVNECKMLFPAAKFFTLCRSFEIIHSLFPYGNDMQSVVQRVRADILLRGGLGECGPCHVAQTGPV